MQRQGNGENKGCTPVPESAKTGATLNTALVEVVETHLVETKMDVNGQKFGH